MMNDSQKAKIVELMQAEKARVGNYASIATRAGVSAATVSQMINGNWELITDRMWSRIAVAIGADTHRWTNVRTTNFNMVWQMLQTAYDSKLFVGIAAPAGSGKTVALKAYTASTPGVYYIEAREWAKREFLRNLCKTLGLPVVYYHTGNKLEEDIIDFFVKKSSKPQMLIVDQANSLKLSALKFFIYLYNNLKDRIAIVLAGTNALESKIKNGVAHNVNGFDEVDSRLGRNFVHLIGSHVRDVQAICAANGLNDKEQAVAVFKEAGPVYERYEGRNMQVVKDLRRIERIITREVKLNH